MEGLSKTQAADVRREKEHGLVSDTLSQPSSYKDYPAPMINPLMHTTAKTRSPSPSKAFPETSREAIVSALRNLQEKIRRLETEKSQAELSLRSLRENATHRHRLSSQSSQNTSRNHADAKTDLSGQSNCNQVLITHLAAAESRCVKLERQLDHMRRMLRSARTERGLLKTQEIAEKAESPSRLSASVHEQIQLQKLQSLEQECQRLTRIQNITGMKIYKLELKLQEEENQRRRVQDKANQIQTGLETNRLLLQAVAPKLSLRQSKEKNTISKQQQQLSRTQPHYRLHLQDTPFVTGTATGCSHSVRANIQSVLSLLRQPQHSPVSSRNVNRSDRGRSSSSSSSSGNELSELLQGLQEELRLMSLEQDELMKELDDTVNEQERKALWREQEKLLVKMEMKAEQIRKLYKHKSQMKNLRKEGVSKPESTKRAPVAATVSTRGHSARVNARPGERSRRNLRLLRDLKALQSSLQH